MLEKQRLCCSQAVSLAGVWHCCSEKRETKILEWLDFFRRRKADPFKIEPETHPFKADAKQTHAPST